MSAFVQSNNATIDLFGDKWLGGEIPEVLYGFREYSNTLGVIPVDILMEVLAGAGWDVEKAANLLGLVKETSRQRLERLERDQYGDNTFTCERVVAVADVDRLDRMHRESGKRSASEPEAKHHLAKLVNRDLPEDDPEKLSAVAFFKSNHHFFYLLEPLCWSCDICTFEHTIPESLLEDKCRMCESPRVQ